MLRVVPAFRLLRAVAVCASGMAGVALLMAGAGSSQMRAGAVGGESASGHGVLIPANPRQVLPLQGHTVQSSNWAGYAVTSKNRRITGITGTFVVPKVGSTPFGFAATWAGIGGYFHDSNLIQAGTAEDSRSNGLYGKQYFAWYELVPRNAEQTLHKCAGDPKCTVKPGDLITVTIRRAGTGEWRISMIDSGHWRWSKQVHWKSSQSSAEWILEAPQVDRGQLTLAPVGTVHFGPTSTFKHASSTSMIAQVKHVKIVLTGEAKPSALGHDGQSFNDCAYKATCSRP